MYGLTLPYNPFGPHAPQKASQPPSEVNHLWPSEPALVSLVAGQARFRAAQAVNATHLSRDGEVAYDQRQYGLWYCTWDEGAKSFGSWFKLIDRDLPADAVVIERSGKS
jgi:hypothetical protein